MTRKIGRFSLIVAMVALMSLVWGCHDWPSEDVIPSSPMWGVWSLESVDGHRIEESQQARYTFRQDPDNRTFNSGIGTFERYDVSAGRWVSSSIGWDVESEDAMVITGDEGGGRFEYLLETNAYRTTLRLFDASSGGAERLFVKVGE